MNSGTDMAHLKVIARAAPELIERVCRVLRHRGAVIDYLVVCSDGPIRTRMDIGAVMVGDIDLLLRQIGRLPDVHLVECHDHRPSGTF